MITLHATERNSLLLVWYLTRSGKTTLKNAAKNLLVDQTVLRDSLTYLQANDIVLFDSDSGEIELIGNPTVSKILYKFKSTLPSIEKAKYSQGKTEHRTLLLLSKMLDEAINGVLNKTMRLVGNDLIVSEVNKMDKVSTETVN